MIKSNAMSRIFVQKSILLAFCVLLSFGFAFAQKTVTGTITDAGNGSTMPGANISVVGMTVGTISDLDGKFTLKVPANGKELLFSMVGYESQTILIGEATVFNVALQEAATSIDEVVVVGYGTQKRSTLTGSVAKLDAKLL